MHILYSLPRQAIHVTGAAPRYAVDYIDPTGVYFLRPEGNAPGNFPSGVSPVKDVTSTDDEDLETVHYDLFDDIIWPTLAHRVPALEEVKVQATRSGYYDYNTLGQNAIIGFHPLVSNLVGV